MADAAASGRTVNLRILSPAVELLDGMDMRDVAAETTIGALKLKLMDAIPSHPTPDRMRLIHYGRLLSDENETLAHLFGETALTQSTPFTIHLVVRAPPTPLETPATRVPLFSSWGAPPASNNTTAAVPAQQPNILPPGASQHPLLRSGTTIIPPGPAATPQTPTPTLQHARSSSANLLQQLMERQQQQIRELQNQRPHSHPPPQLVNTLRPDMNQPPPPTSAPATPPLHAHHPHAHPHGHGHPHIHLHQPHAHPHAHPHPHPHPQPSPQPHPQARRHASITINQTTMAVPMPMPMPGFPPLHNLIHHFPQPQLQQFNPAAPTVYLLSSPQGPHALLFSPQGTFTANIPQMQQPHNPFGQMTMPNPLFNHTRPHTPAAPQQNPQPVIVDPQQPPDQVAQQVVQQLNQGGAENQQFDALAPWQPLLAQGWMLLRLLFFAWILLGTGQGWRRPLALLAIGVVFWVINAGGIGDSVRDAVRSWWEGVVGLPTRNEAQQNQPQQQEQQHGMIRQALRPAERALALFIASLWPGVGERTVTAMREEEDRQRREEQERTRAEEERQRQLEADQSAPQENAAQTEESNQITALDDQATVTATGTDVSAMGQDVRERKAATHDAGEEQPSAAQSTLSREEQSAQQTQNLGADW